MSRQYFTPVRLWSDIPKDSVTIAQNLAFIRLDIRAGGYGARYGLMASWSQLMQTDRKYDVLAFGAHPDDLEAVMGGTTVKLVRKGLSVLFVDLCDGEPARHAPRGERQAQALQAAEILGVERITLALQDRLIADTVEARFQGARLLREYPALC